MIKNIIFDFGQVLVRFDPKYMTEKYVRYPQDSALLQEVIFDRLYWDKLDLGTISDGELTESVCARLPERLHRSARDIYGNWFRDLPEINGIRKLIEELKYGYGVKLFLLSNISKSFSAHRSEIPILKYFDKCIMSADYGVVKPSREIFEILCKECQIKKEESVFIDDSPKNIAGAEAFGIKSFLFNGNTVALSEYLKELLDINIKRLHK